MRQDTERSTATIPLSVCIGYAVPYISVNWLFIPISLIQGIYTKYYGMSLSTVAALMLLVRLSDTVTDPLIAYCSDRYYQRFQTRKPFILAGGVLLVFSGYFLFVPTDLRTFQPLLQVNEFYFVTWFIVFFIAFTLFEMPHIAWANELAPNGQDKVKIMSFRAGALYIGVIAFYSIPSLPIFSSSEITPEVLRVSVMSSGVAMLLLLCYGLLKTPDKSPMVGIRSTNEMPRPDTELADAEDHVDRSIFIFLKSLINNKPLLLIVCAFMSKGMAVAMFMGMFFIYVDVYLGLGSEYAKTSLAGYFVALASIPVWRKIARRASNKAAWIISTICSMFAFLLISTFSPEKTEFFDLLVVVSLNGVAGACMWNIALAMYGEVIDYSTWKYRRKMTASYFSVYTLLSKTIVSLSMSLGLAIAGWYGLDATATVHDDNAVWGLKLVMTWIPFGFASLALVFIFLGPIDERRHQIILRRLTRCDY